MLMVPVAPVWSQQVVLRSHRDDIDISSSLSPRLASAGQLVEAVD